MRGKKEYVCIDILKFLGAFLVAAIHLLPFEDVSHIFSYYFTAVICRLAVPFFFVCAGFFLGERYQEKTRVKQYIARLLLLYGIWTLLYLPQIIYHHAGKEIGALQIAKEIFLGIILKGTYTQFWYFPALILAVILVFVLKGKLRIPDKYFIPVVCVLYTVGVMGNSGFGFIDGTDSWIAKAYSVYNKFFETTRNGLFFSLFYFYVGILIARRECSRAENAKKPLLYWVLFAVGVLVMLLERRWLLYVTQFTISDMTFAMVPTVYCLFMAGIQTGKKKSGGEMGKMLRNCGTLIFCAHLLVDFYLHKFMVVIGAGKIMGYSLGRFLCVYLATTGLAVLIVLLSKKKGFSYLRILY